MNTESAERKTLFVIVLTLLTMIAEIVIGHYTRSMALFADGWHMGTHALALSLTYLTYILIRKFSNSAIFANGTGKFGCLSGYTSSIILGITGILIIFESTERFLHPLNINFNDALIVAIVGFVVNFACILVMGTHESCACNEHHHDEDYNFKSAYFHILADTMTSVFAIIALFTGKYFGFSILDPIVGFIGGCLICGWAWGLIKSTSMILLDAENNDLKAKIAESLKNDVKFKNLKVWRVSECENILNAEVETEIPISDLKSKISELGEFHDIMLSKL